MRVSRLLASAAVASTVAASAIPTAAKIDEHVLVRRQDTKYFHEPGGSEILGHYDLRYFKGQDSYEDRLLTLRHLTRAYLNWFRDHGLETWIAHGTLLGWWWSGGMLPWDWDVDTQVADSTLKHLAQNYNMTRWPYESDLGDDVKREYLLDVNPYSAERVRGDGNNVIDARWIDTSNGLYIDITGLTETRPDEDPGVWSCKNEHRYRTRDLFPLRPTLFEGVVAWVPFNYAKILVQEYNNKALTLEEYEGHRWDQQSFQWVKMKKEGEGEGQGEGQPTS
ncbi:LicD family-domain-containing protein [Phyllosticta citriasiana]|uniref:LicD family-domain-containing protein n=1 Tax=Phyllosticta citriasiana TaxID=595635 RepID=A0ABR1L2T1_9PEZI